MRVLHIINDLRLAGAELQVRYLAPLLQAGGDTVEVALLQNTPSPVRDALENAGVLVHAPPSGVSFYNAPAQARYLAGVMRGVDIAHVHLFPAQAWAALASRLLPRQSRPVLITTEHSTHNRRRRAIFRPFDTAFYSTYDVLVAVSQPVAESLGKWVPHLRGHIVVVHPAIHGDRFARAVPASKAEVLGPENADVTVLLCVGRLEAQKDQGTLLRTLVHLPPDIHAVFAGDGPLRSEFAALVQTQNVASRVHFLGRRDDVPALVKMAAVYVQPSRWEGWSAAILEVMASGTVPIVASDAPGLGEAVQGCGLLFPVGDEKALAQSVQTLLHDAPLAARMVANGVERAKAFDWAGCVRAHQELYADALAARAASGT